MKKISYINKTALKKDILRYSPIWALYTIFLLLVLFGVADFSRETIAMDMTDSLRTMAWLNLFYGGICGVFLFMDLFNGRLCNALHAFPVRREGWLATHILSGVLFSFVPNLLVTAISALMLWEYAYIAPIWLAVSTLQYLFFFGTAVLAATCAGNLLGTVAIYGITHFITVFVYVVTELLYQPLLYGVRLNSKVFYYFFPLDQMDGFDYAIVRTYNGVKQCFEFLGLDPKAWRYVGICAAVGILALFLARFVYRRRNLESAGDFISLRPIAPLFMLVVTVGAGAFLYMFSDLVSEGSYLFLVLGMIIGYFAGKMLLARTLKVFDKKSLLTLGVILLALGGSIGLTWLDPLGIASYVPKAENVESAYIYGADKGYYYLLDSYFSSTVGYEQVGGFAITDSEEVATLQDFHRQLTQYRPTEDDGVLCDVRIYYKLKNGRTVTRYYEVGRDTVLGQKARAYFNDMRYLFDVDDTDVLYDAFESVYIDIYEDGINQDFKLTDRQDIADLLDAVAADCEAGNIAQNWAFHNDTDAEVKCYLEFYVRDSAFNQGNWNTSRFHLQIYSDSANTIEYMKQMAEAYAQQQEQTDEPITDVKIVD